MVRSPWTMRSDVEAAKTKGITSLVAGRAEILIVPNLEAGNMLAKELVFVAHAEAAGLAVGATVPIILTSRADGEKARLASCAIAALYAGMAGRRTNAAPGPRRRRPSEPHVLTLNAGSSSIKFALFAIGAGSDLTERLRGQVEGLGATPRLQAASPGAPPTDRPLDPAQAHDHASALAIVLDALQQDFDGVAIGGVGHRIVHGGVDFSESIVLDPGRLAVLERLCPLAPLHQPHNLSGVRAAQAAFPQAMQVACFDTAFHRTHPWVNDTYALPRKLYEDGIRRYGFHGLSYEYVTQRLAEDSAAACGRTRGGRASRQRRLDVRDPRRPERRLHDGIHRLGRPADGHPLRPARPRRRSLPCGERMTPTEIEDLLYRRSGLKGLSGLSQDMRELEAAGTPEAQQAD